MTLVLIASQPNGSIQNARGDAQSGGSSGTATFRNTDGTAPNHFDGTLVTHYADAAGTGGSTAAITADSRGRLMRWIAAGSYKQIINGESLDFHATPGSVESRVGPIELDIRAYTGFDFGGGSNMSSMMATAGAAGAAVAVSSGRPVVIGGFRNAVVRTDSTLQFYDRVKWRLDEARFVAGADLGTTGMFRVTESLTADTAIGAGTTANTSYLVTAVANIASWAKEDRVVAAGVTAGTKVVAVDIVNSVLVLDAPATASATVTLSRGATYYGKFRDCGLIGGTLDPNGKQCGAIVRALFTERFVLEGTEAIHNRKTGDDNWAFQVGGRDMLARWPKVTGGTKVFQDGFHFEHGQRLRLEAPDIESGDDAIVLGGEPADGVLGPYPDPIRDITIGRCQVRSARGYGLSIYVASGATGRDWEITNVNVEAIVGSAGTLSNGGIRIVDKNNGVAGTSQIRRVTVNGAALQVGSRAYDDVNPTGIEVQSVSHLTLKNIDIEMTDKPSASIGFVLCTIRASEDVTIDTLRCNALQKRWGVDARTSNRVTIKNSKLRVTSATSQYAISLIDMQDVKVLDNVLLDVVDGSSGISIQSGTLTNGLIRGNTVKHAAGATTGQAVVVLSTAITHLTLIENDFSGAVAGANTGSLFVLGKCLSQGNRNLVDYGVESGDRLPLSAYFTAGVTVLTATPTQMLAAIHAGLDASALTGGTLAIPVTAEPLVISGPIVPPYNSRMAGPSTARFSEMTGGSHGSSANQWPVLPNVIGVAWIQLASGANTPILANDYTNAVGKRGPDPRGDGNRYVQRFTARGIVFDHNGANQTGALRAMDMRKAWGMNFEYCHLVNPRGLGWSYDNCDDCNSEKLSAVGSTENVANGTGTTTSGSPTITGAGGTWAIGDLIGGVGIPAGTFVSNVVTTTLTLAKTSDGTAQNATANGTVTLNKQTMTCTALLSLTNTTVDSEHIGISMHGSQNGVVLDGAFGCRVSGLTGYAIGGYNLQILDSGGVTGGCRQHEIDLRAEQATKHNVRLSSGAKSMRLNVKTFACGLFNTPADSDGGWANVFDDGKANVVTGTGGRGNAVFGPSNLPIHVFGPNATMGSNDMGGGDDLAANTVLYKWRPVDSTAPGTQRSNRHRRLPDPFEISPRALSGVEGTALAFAAFNGTLYEVAVLPNGAISTVLAYITIPPGANSVRVQVALVNLNNALSGNVNIQLGYSDTTEIGANTPGGDEGSVVTQIVAIPASNLEKNAGFGPDGGAVGFPGSGIQCGQHSILRLKRLTTSNTLAADIGVKGILVTPLLLAA